MDRFIKIFRKKIILLIENTLSLIHLNSNVEREKRTPYHHSLC